MEECNGAGQRKTKDERPLATLLPSPSPHVQCEGAEALILIAILRGRSMRRHSELHDSLACRLVRAQASRTRRHPESRLSSSPRCISACSSRRSKRAGRLSRFLFLGVVCFFFPAALANARHERVICAPGLRPATAAKGSSRRFPRQSGRRARRFVVGLRTTHGGQAERRSNARSRRQGLVEVDVIGIGEQRETRTNQGRPLA